MTFKIRFLRKSEVQSDNKIAHRSRQILSRLKSFKFGLTTLTLGVLKIGGSADFQALKL